MKVGSPPEFFHKSCLTNNYFSCDPHLVILAWEQSWNIFEKLMKLWIPPEFIHKNMSHDHMKSNCSDITVSSVFQIYFNFVPMLESRNMDPLKNNFSCDFFCEKIEVDITVSWNFQNYFNFLPTLQLQLKNVSQFKDNVHETHLFWKYPTYVAVLSLIVSTFCLC